MERASSELLNLMNEAIKHKQEDEKTKLTSRQIARHLRISDQRFSTYATGSRIPRQAFAEKLANYFYRTREDRTRFLSALSTIRTSLQGDHHGTARASLLERLARGEPLRVSTLEIEPFAGTNVDFFDQVFHRFFRLSGLTTRYIPKLSFEIGKALWQNTLDLCLGCFASVDRAVLAHFWTAPIRLSLGAIIHSKHEQERERVKRILSLQEHKIHHIRPIVVKGEVGHIYCRERLGFEPADIVCLEQLKPAVLADSLRQLCTESAPIPVVVVNEHTAFGLLRELRTEGIPVIPFNTWENALTDTARRELPQYFLGFACGRGQQELQAMIDQAFWLFLSTELDTTADALAALYENLMQNMSTSGGNSETVVDYYFERPAEPHDGEMEARRFRLARDWTLYALMLDRKSIADYPTSGPWRAILRRAREIVQEGVALDPREINNQIALCTGYPDHPRPLSHDQFRELCAVFDLPEPELSYAQRQYIFEDHDMVRATIQNALRGGSLPPLEPPALHVVVVSPLTKESASIASGFIGEMSKLYVRELGESNSATKQINEFLSPAVVDPIERYQGLSREFTSVVLASHGKHGRHYVGCVCLRPHKDDRGEAIRGELELCYLFVLEPFRKLKIARHLIHKAHQVAKEQHYTTLVCLMLPQYFEGILYLEKRGFTRSPDRLGKDGRIVLEYKTEDPFPCPKSSANR
jgi:GNAT superfamily N-acetyltransferase/transcriptional regulator with XRE-family HTH domain